MSRQGHGITGNLWAGTGQRRHLESNPRGLDHVPLNHVRCLPGPGNIQDSGMSLQHSSLRHAHNAPQRLAELIMHYCRRQRPHRILYRGAICRREIMSLNFRLVQWFLTWGPGTPWGSQTPILGVPNANLEYQQILPNIFASHSLRVAFVYTLRTLSYLASHSSSVFSSFLFFLLYLFGRAAIKVETTVRLPGERFLLTLFRNAYFFNFDLGGPRRHRSRSGDPSSEKG